jgi:hypothetical protein
MKQLAAPQTSEILVNNVLNTHMSFNSHLATSNPYALMHVHENGLEKGDFVFIAYSHLCASMPICAMLSA